MAPRRRNNRNNEGELERNREDFAGESSSTPSEFEGSRDSGRENLGREGYGRESMTRDFDRGRDFGRGRELGYGSEGRGAQGSYGRESYGPGGMTGRESSYEAGAGFGTGYSGGNLSERDRWGTGARFEQQIGRESFGGTYNPPSRYDRESFGGGYGPSTGIYGAEPGAWRAEEGPFRGRGPRGYQRSDERIQEDVCERLSQHGRVDATNVDVKVQGAEVTLTGTVEDRQMKRLAEDLAENVSGVKQVHNQIRIGPSPQESKTQAGTRTTRGKSGNRNR